MPDRKPTPTVALRRLMNRIRARGIAEVWELGWTRLRENVWSDQSLTLYVREASSDGVPSDPGFRRATQEDAQRYAHDIGTDSADTFLRRLASDVRCYVIEENDRLLHSSWVTDSGAWTREIRDHLSPPPGDCYVYESFTRADARGRGIYPRALSGILAASDSLGRHRVWVGVETHNRASRRSIDKAGFTAVFELSYGRRFGILLGPSLQPDNRESRSFIGLPAEPPPTR